MPYKPAWKMEHYNKHDNEVSLEAQCELMRYLDREQLISDNCTMVKISREIWNKIFIDMGIKSIWDADN